RLIGRLCKRGNALSRPVLMGRGLDGYFSLLACVQFSSVAGAARSRTISVAIARGKHLFPFRTEPLSPSAPMVLGGQPPGRVGRRRSFFAKPPSEAAFSLRLRLCSVRRRRGSRLGRGWRAESPSRGAADRHDRPPSHRRRGG